MDIISGLEVGKFGFREVDMIMVNDKILSGK
jgi:hypothetical protein